MKRAICVIFVAIAILFTTACGNVSKPNPIEQNTSNIRSQKIIDLNELDYKLFKDVANAGITSQTWDDASQIRPEFLVNFFGARTELSWLSIDMESAEVPAELVESFVKLHFDVDASHLQKAEFYNEDKNAYELPTPPSGAASFKVVDAVMDNCILTLFYEYYSPADDITVIRKGNLKIEFPDEYQAEFQLQYRYISCETTEING